MLHFRLHAKFLVLVLGSLIVFLGVLSYAVVHREASILARKADEKQHVLAFTIFADLKTSMMKGTPRRTLNLMNSIRGTYGLVRLETLRKDGSPAFGIKGSRFDIPQLERAYATGEEISFQEKGAVPLHTILYPLKNEGKCVACHSRQNNILGVLLISLSLEDTIREIRTSKRNLAFSLSALIFMIGGMLYFVIRRVVLQPLAILHEGAKRIGKGEFAHRISLSTNDEIQDLARSFNVMAGRIEESYSGLENRIRERTAQLYDTMAEVEDKAKRLYDFSRDMATISRLSTTVFNAEQSLDQMLDRFMRAVDRGLGYKQAVLCLVDRTQVWLDVKRDSGLGAMLGITSQSLSGDSPFTALVRTGKEVSIEDIAHDPVFSRCRRTGVTEPVALHVIPILTGTHSKMCWQERNCIRTDCPAYKVDDKKCWLVENTLCGNALVESYNDKFAYCMTCEVFPVLGILLVAARPGRPFRRRDVSVLRILAAEIGAALENHRLYGDNRQLVKELLELHMVTASALAELSLDRALEAFTDSALKFSGLDACNFWLLSEDGQELTRKAGGCIGPGSETDFCPERITTDAGVLGRAFRQNRIVTEYNTVFNDPTPLGKATTAHQLPSLLVVPLKTEGRPIGVFTVHKKSTAPFLETEIAAFMLLANHAAMAINVCILSEELKNQNRELARNINLREGILASMSSGVMLLDMNGTVELINQAGAEILHSRPADVMNRRLMELAPDAAAFLKSSVGPYQEVEIRRQDGTSIPIGFSSAYYHGASGTREGIIVVYRNLTEIKALQAEVLNKERFAAMGRVVAGVAHEIRNPLFGISSVSQIFERELQNPAHRELAGALLAETKRLNQLVEELLIYGRPMKLMPEWCDLTKLWEEVVEMHQHEIGKKGIRIGSDLDIGHTLALLDVNQIRQVCLNLLRNAIDATPAGGEIAIKLLLDDRDIIFKIIDTGVGISAANLDKVFDLFFTTKSRGTGLGLGICRKIVEDHGGEISIESRKGTAVTVKLPYRGTSESTNIQVSDNN
jgi:signal transduction histidine kinase